MELIAPETFERGFLSNQNLIKFDKKKIFSSALVGYDFVYSYSSRWLFAISSPMRAHRINVKYFKNPYSCIFVSFTSCLSIYAPSEQNSKKNSSSNKKTILLQSSWWELRLVLSLKSQWINALLQNAHSHRNMLPATCIHMHINVKVFFLKKIRS